MKKTLNPFLILLAITLAIHFFLPLNWGDDKVFNAESVMSLSVFLKGSSRILTDTMTYVFCRWHFLWRFINPFIITFLVYCLSQITDIDISERKQIFALYAVTLFPTMFMVDAGFIATTVNYLWPTTFGMYNILLFKRACNREPVSVLQKIFAFPLLIYALNMEQMSAVLTVVFVAGTIYFIYSKHLNFYTLLQALISVAGLLYAYFGNVTGDASRMVREIGRYFPDFESLNIFQKIELGFSSTFYCMLFDLRFASIGFAAFTAFLSFMIFKKTNKLSYKILSVILPCLSLVLSTLNLFFKFTELTHYRMTKAIYHFDLVEDIFFIFIAIAVFAELFILIGKNLTLVKCYLIICLGTMTRMIMGFSPTVWASGYRTFCLMFIAFILVAFTVYRYNSPDCGPACKSL